MRKIASKSRTQGIDFLSYYKDSQIEAARETIVDRFKQSRDWRYYWRSKWIEYYQLYRCYSAYYEENPDWQSAYFVPMIFQFIELIIPRIIDAIYSFPPTWIATPSRFEMREESHLAETLLDTRARSMNLFKTHYDSFKGMLIYGTAWEKLAYKVTREYEGPWWYDRDIFDMYPDPLNSEVEDMRFIVDRQPMHFDDMKELEAQKTWKKVDRCKNSQHHDELFSTLDRMRTIGGPSQDNADMDDYHEVLEYWGKYKDPSTNEVFDMVMVVADREFVLRFEECPYSFGRGGDKFNYARLPFLKFVDVPVPHECYGIGEAEVLRYPQLYLNDMRNMRADALNYAVSPVYQVIRAAIEGRSLDKIVFSPGALIPVHYANVDPIRPIQTNTAGISLSRMEGEDIKQEMRDTTGVQLPMFGAEGTTRKTASEFVSALQESNARVKMKVQILENTVLDKQGRMTYLMDRQFTDTKVMARTFGITGIEGFATINPKELKWEGDFQIQPLSKYGMRQVEGQRLMEFFKLAAEATPLTGPIVDFRVLTKAIADSLDIKYRDLIIKEPAKDMPVAMQDKIKQAMLEQAQQAGPEMAQGGATAPATAPTEAPQDEAAALLSGIQSERTAEAPRLE